MAAARNFASNRSLMFAYDQPEGDEAAVDAKPDLDGEFFYINEHVEEEGVEQVVEYIDEVEEEAITSMASPAELDQKPVLANHTLLMTEDENGREFYRCLQCNIAYADIDDFTAAHKGGQTGAEEGEEAHHNEGEDDELLEVAESQWEAIDVDESLAVEEHLIAQIKVEKGTASPSGGQALKDHQQDIIEAEFWPANAEEEEAETRQSNTDEEFIAEGEAGRAAQRNAFTITQISAAGEEDIDEDEDEEDHEESVSAAARKMAKDKEKYFCCECQTVFADLRSAEQHDCPGAAGGGGNSTVRDDAEGETTADGEEDDEEEQDENQAEDIEGFDYEGGHIETRSNRSGSGDFKCSHCGRTFYTVQALNSHSRMHKPKARNADSQALVTCHICNTNFSSKKNMLFHMRIHRERPTKSIQDALPVGALRQYSELNQFFCELCNKSFDQNLLLVHKNMHQQLATYTCSYCNRQFDNADSYEMHVRVHQHHQPVMLSSGGDNNEAGSVLVHQTPLRGGGMGMGRGTGRGGTGRGRTKAAGSSEGGSVRGPDGKMRFPCQYCGYEFSRPYEKVKHERCHTGEKPYECEVCGKTFRVSYSLTLHLRTHTNIRPYVCPTCNKRFKSQPVYVTHLKTHQTERAYKCDHCPKTFRTAVQLCGHRKSHTKPFSCPECNRPFAALYDVRLHMKTHTRLQGNNNNKGGGGGAGGNAVGGGVSSKGNESLKYRCGMCGAVYARLFALRLHMKEQHALDVDAQQALELQYSGGGGGRRGAAGGRGRGTSGMVKDEADSADEGERNEEEDDDDEEIDEARDEDEAAAALISAVTEADEDITTTTMHRVAKVRRGGGRTGEIVLDDGKRRRMVVGRRTRHDVTEEQVEEMILPHEEMDFNAEEIVDDGTCTIEEIAIETADDDGDYDWLEGGPPHALTSN